MLCMYVTLKCLCERSRIQLVDFLVLRNGLTPGVVRRTPADKGDRRTGLAVIAGVLVIIFSDGYLNGGDADFVLRDGEG